MIAEVVIAVEVGAGAEVGVAVAVEVEIAAEAAVADGEAQRPPLQWASSHFRVKTMKAVSFFAALPEVATAAEAETGMADVALTVPKRNWNWPLKIPVQAGDGVCGRAAVSGGASCVVATDGEVCDDAADVGDAVGPLFAERHRFSVVNSVPFSLSPLYALSLPSPVFPDIDCSRSFAVVVEGFEMTTLLVRSHRGRVGGAFRVRILYQRTCQIRQNSAAGDVSCRTRNFERMMNRTDAGLMLDCCHLPL